MKSRPLKNVKETVYYQLVMSPTHAVQNLIIQESVSDLVSYSALMVTYAWDNTSAAVQPAETKLYT